MNANAIDFSLITKVNSSSTLSFDHAIKSKPRKKALIEQVLKNSFAATDISRCNEIAIIASTKP